MDSSQGDLDSATNGSTPVLLGKLHSGHASGACCARALVALTTGAVTLLEMHNQACMHCKIACSCRRSWQSQQWCLLWRRFGVGWAV